MLGKTADDGVQLCYGALRVYDMIPPGMDQAWMDKTDVLRCNGQHVRRDPSILDMACTMMVNSEIILSS